MCTTIFASVWSVYIILGVYGGRMWVSELLLWMKHCSCPLLPLINEERECHMFSWHHLHNFHTIEMVQKIYKTLLLITPTLHLSHGSVVKFNELATLWSCMYAIIPHAGKKKHVHSVFTWMCLGFIVVIIVAVAIPIVLHHEPTCLPLCKNIGNTLSHYNPISLISQGLDHLLLIMPTLHFTHWSISVVLKSSRKLPHFQVKPLLEKRQL